jgi:hypothetical protein
VSLHSTKAVLGIVRGSFRAVLVAAVAVVCDSNRTSARSVRLGTQVYRLPAEILQNTVRDDWMQTSLVQWHDAETFAVTSPDQSLDFEFPAVNKVQTLATSSAADGSDLVKAGLDCAGVWTTGPCEWAGTTAEWEEAAWASVYDDAGFYRPQTFHQESAMDIDARRCAFEGAGHSHSDTGQRDREDHTLGYNLDTEEEAAAKAEHYHASFVRGG